MARKAECRGRADPLPPYSGKCIWVIFREMAHVMEGRGRVGGDQEGEVLWGRGKRSGGRDP